MKLLTKAIINKMPKMYSTDKTPEADKVVVVKFFCPWNSWTWFVFEGELQDNGDWQFFGKIHGQDTVLGYFHLSELKSITGFGGLKIERDLSVSGQTYGELN